MGDRSSSRNPHQGRIPAGKDYRTALENEKRTLTDGTTSSSPRENQKTFLDRASNVVIKSILLEVFQWKEGNYRFEDWEVDTENILACHIPSEGIILDTLRVIDEWPMVKQKIPPVDYCPVTIMPLTEEIVKKHRLGAVDMHIYDLIDEKDLSRTLSGSPWNPLRSFELDCQALGFRPCRSFPQGTKEVRDSSIARRILLAKIKKVMVYVLLAVAAGSLYLAGEPRILKGIGIPEKITSCVRDQKELAADYAQREIMLLRLGTDTDNRLSASSRE